MGPGEGAGGPPPTQPYALLPRWKSFHGNLLWYQQQLEGALEIHTLSRELDDITEQIGEKVTSERPWQLGGVALTQSFPCVLPRPPSPLQLGYWRQMLLGVLQGWGEGSARGSPDINSGPQKPPLQAWRLAHLASRNTVGQEARAELPHELFHLLSLSKARAHRSLAPEHVSNHREMGTKCWRGGLGDVKKLSAPQEVPCNTDGALLWA